MTAGRATDFISWGYEETEEKMLQEVLHANYSCFCKTTIPLFLSVSRKREPRENLWKSVRHWFYVLQVFMAWSFDFESTLVGAILSRWLTIALADSHRRITIMLWKQWLFIRPDPGTRKHHGRAAITEMTCVLYLCIGTRCGIQESRSREPITRNGSREREREKDTRASGPIFSLLKLPRRSFVRSPLGSSLSS